MRGRLRRFEDRIPHALRLLCGELATPESGSDGVDASAREISERENARAAREERAAASDRPLDRPARELPKTTPQIYRNNLGESRADLDSRAELRQPARDHRRDQKPAAADRRGAHR